MNGKPKAKFYAGVKWGGLTPTVILVGLNLEELVIVYEFYQEKAQITQVIDAAKERGGEDNIAVVLIYVYKNKWKLYLRKLLRWARR